MKLEYKPAEKDSLSSIYVKRIQEPYLQGNWHFHKEFELIYFLEGQGMRIVGDHISNFKTGELVLVGAWLPHLWLNDASIYGNTRADFIVIKFPTDFAGVSFFTLPELADVKRLLKTASQGLLFSKSLLPSVHDLIIQLHESSGTARFIKFLQVLEILSKAKEYKLLSKPDYSLPSQVSGENRLQKVINYISSHYAQAISLDDIAQIAHMTPPAFCRFFKARTNKTFSLFLNEVRISKACQLLIDDEKSIKQICYEVGFSSLTNFNRTFRSFKEMTPSKYRASYDTIRR